MDLSQPHFAIPNVRLFIAFRVLFNCRFYYPIFTILFLDYGLTIEQFALLNTVWAITIVLAEVPSGALADVIGRKRLLVATALLMVTEMALIAFVPLGNITLVFWAFLINRVLSGLAEAMASGADEAIAYDSLAASNLENLWPKVLSLQMRLKAAVSIATGTIGALLYDPELVNRCLKFFALTSEVTQQQTMRYPIYLTLLLALLALWTSLGFQETLATRAAGSRFLQNVTEAMVVTWRAGGWILRTPFALAIIAWGMYYDHFLRMIVTMVSQYFRLISLPEASFGIIAAALSLLGLLVPKFCEHLVEVATPAKNLLVLLVIALLGTLGLTFFIPYWGLLPMGCIFIAMMMVSFFTSHYLNRITDSSQRATVLSFKGMAFNLAYGVIGALFAGLMQLQRASQGGLHPDWSGEQIENASFIAAMGWFPWYAIVLFVLLMLLLRTPLRRTREHLQTG